MQVLIVDDEPLVTRLVTRLLGTQDFEQIDTAQDGAAALGLIQQNQYRLVISDFHMEPITGLDVLRAVRADWRTRETYFLMMAGGTGVEQVTAAHHAGMDGYILKPFTATRLCSKINEAFLSRRWNSHQTSLGDLSAEP